MSGLYEAELSYSPDQYEAAKSLFDEYNNEDDKLIRIDYNASSTCTRFHKSDDYVRGICGPVGSGKSVACCWEIYMRAAAQPPGPDGVRRTRWAVVRNTYSELLSTTIKTFHEWFYKPVCTYHMSAPLSAKIAHDLPDGTRIEAEVLFLACDRPEDTGKFRSLELTGAWINEASQILRKSILDDIAQRTGRSPKKWKDQDTGEQTGGPVWFGVIMDTNAPDDEHWWYELAEVEKPDGYKFFRQPPAVLLAPNSTPKKPVYVPNTGQNPRIPAAENVDNIPAGWPYYMKMIPGKPYDWIRVFLMAEYGTVSYGKPVYPQYNDQVHYLPNQKDGEGKAMDVTVMRGLPLLLGWDFGYQFSACVFAQLTRRGQLRVIEEIVGRECGIRDFINEVVRPHIRLNYPDSMHILSYGDPSGESHSSTDGNECIKILCEEGIYTEPAPTNSPTVRQESVRYFLTKMIDGQPGLVVGSKAPTIRKGFNGRYCVKEMTVSKEEIYSGKPVKNLFSHPHDGLQYIATSIRQSYGSLNQATRVNDSNQYPGIPQHNTMPGMNQAIDMEGFF